MFHPVKTEHWTNEKRIKDTLKPHISNIYMFWKVDFLDNHCRLLCLDDVVQLLQLWSHKTMICMLTYWGKPPLSLTNSLWNQFVSSHSETSRTKRSSLRDAHQSVRLQLKKTSRLASKSSSSSRWAGRTRPSHLLPSAWRTCCSERCPGPKPSQTMWCPGPPGGCTWCVQNGQSFWPDGGRRTINRSP